MNPKSGFELGITQNYVSAVRSYDGSKPLPASVLNCALYNKRLRVFLIYNNRIKRV